MFKSLPHVKAGGDMVNKVRAPFLEGRLNLRKLTSNDIDPLRVIPKTSDRME